MASHIYPSILKVIISFLILFGISGQPLCSQDLNKDLSLPSSGTKITLTKKEQLLVRERFQQFYASKRNTRKNLQNETVYIPVQIHIIRMNDQSGGIPFSDVKRAFEANVAPAFKGANIDFSLCSEANYIDNSGWFDITAQQANTLANRFNVPSVLNIYFTQFEFCGQTQIPTTGRDLENDFIIINNDCATDGSTISYELGHFFGLFDTDEDQFGEECPDGSNCNNAGDLICDTPADPGLSRLVVDMNCNYVGRETACDLPYNPDVTNIMANSNRGCRLAFSPDQLAMMYSVATNERNYLDIQICQETRLSYANHIIDDDNIDSRGDNDGRVEPGEVVELKVVLRNNGEEDITDITGTLSTEDPFIARISDSVEDWDDIVAQGTGICKLDFDFSVSNNCPDKYVVFNLDIVSDQGSWRETFRIRVFNKPNLVSCGDDLNTISLNGNILRANVNVRNTGNAKAENSKVGFYLSRDADINANDFFLGESAVGALGANASSVESIVRDISKLSIAPGIYYLGFLVDYNNEIDEIEEDDNGCYWTTPELVLPLSSGLANLTACGDPDNSVSINRNIVNIALDVTNVGSGAAGSFKVAYYLSTNTSLNSSDFLLGESVVSSLNPGASTSTSFTIDASGLNVPDGAYYIGYIIDADNDVTELIESDNNCHFSSPRITLPVYSGLPNLTSCGDPRNLIALNESILNLTAVVSNRGSAPSGITQIGYYLSADSNITTNDYFLGEASLPVIGVNNFHTNQITFDLTQFSVPAGSYYVGYVLNYRNQIEESIQVDNSCFWRDPLIEMPIFSGPPNLSSCGNAANNLSINGSTLQVIVDVTNKGTGIASPSTLGYFLSTNTTITTADYLIGEDAVGTLLPGEGSLESLSIDLTTLNIPNGNYYVGYILDYKNAVSESSDTDNDCFWSNPRVTLPVAPNQPNLFSCGNTSNDLNINGSVMQITVDVTNVGTVTAGTSYLGYYLSTNTTITTADYLIGEDFVTSLPSGSGSIESITVDLSTLNIPNGTYYVGYILDYQGQVTESNESDNDCYWSSTQVTLPVVASGDPNLTSCGDSDNDIEINGTNLIMTTEVTNSGSGTAGTSYVGYYLSTNTDISTNDYFLGESFVSSLGPGGISVESFTIDLTTLNIPNGTYYVGYILDYRGNVSESSETDNDCYWTGPQVTLPIDLNAPNLHSCGNSANNLNINGTTLEITVDVTNKGTGTAGASYIGYYLSTNDNISTSDYLIGDDFVSSLPAGSGSIENIIVDLTTLNVPAGTYYVGYILDYREEVAESNETDNECYWSSSQITLPIVANSPNFGSCGGPATDVEINGTSLTITVEVENIGTGTAGTSYVGYYLSTNDIISTGDNLIGEDFVTSLSPGQSSIETITIDLSTLSLPAGTYYIGFIQDYRNQVTESDETDNDCYWISPQVTLPVSLNQPNLNSCGNAANDVDITGTTLTITVDVTNKGTGNAGSSYIGYYLSTNDNISTVDFLLGEDFVTSLSPGGNSLESITVDLSTLNIPDGTYYIGYILDYKNEVSESDESDNWCYWTSPQVSLPAIIEQPNFYSCGNAGNDMSINGSSLQITVDVTNIGAGSAGSSYVGYYLSTDDNISTSDYRIGEDFVTSLPAGGNSLESITVDLTTLNIPNGEYYVGYVLDYRGQVVESDESDNRCYWSSPRVTLPIVVGKPDFGCGTGTITTINATTYDLDVDVTNIGAGVAGSSTIAYYLFSQEWIDTGNGYVEYLGDDFVRSLDPGEVSAEFFRANLGSSPAPAGVHYLGYYLDIDEEVDENDESNNGCYFSGVPITFPISGATVVSMTKSGHQSTNLPLKQGIIDLGTGIEFGNVELINELELVAVPNPARTQTEFRFNLPNEASVSLVITDLQGRTLAMPLNNEFRQSGLHRLNFNTSELSPGMYICTLNTSQTRKVYKLIISK